jgi:hypothetical protein
MGSGMGCVSNEAGNSSPGAMIADAATSLNHREFDLTEETLLKPAESYNRRGCRVGGVHWSCYRPGLDILRSDFRWNDMAHLS